MIGKVIEIGKTSVVVELAINDEQKKNLMNFHVAFDTDTSTIIGEITSIGEKNAEVALVGEINNGVFVPGISKKPFYKSFIYLHITAPTINIISAITIFLVKNILYKLNINDIIK